MSFAVNEISNYGGRPIALYEFSIGTLTWRYAASEEDVVRGGFTYLARAVSDSGIIQSGDAQTDDLRITIPANEDLALLYRGTPPSETIWVTLRETHHGDTDAPVVWVGYITSLKQISLASVEISCQVMTASFNRNGLRLSWGRQCPHALYDRNCRAVKTSFAVSLQVSALNGSTISSAGLGSIASGWLANGFFEFASIAGTMERRAIESNTTALIRVLGTTDGLEVGDWITAYPGCNRTTAHCNTKFNNLSNFGGIPRLPGKSPFAGDPVF